MEQTLEDLYFGKNLMTKFIEHIKPYYESIQSSKSCMDLFSWQIYFPFIYYTCIRPGAEAKRVKKKDLNIESKIAQIENHKRGYKKTTIPPPMIKPLEKFLKNFKDDEVIFNGDRKTFWSWAKEIGRMAGIQYYEEFEKRQTEGLYTYVFKHGYIQRLEFEGCPPSLISIKSRHMPDSRMAKVTVNYARSLRGLSIWESQHITEVLPI